jgi:hypothetical protein
MHQTLRTGTVAVLGLALLMGSGGRSPTPTSAITSGDGTARLPNLKVLPLGHLTVETVDGQRLLRFTTIAVNRGPGPFELRGSRPSTNVEAMHIDQVIYEQGGGRHRRHTGAIATYAGDGHDHWHVQNVTSYEMWRVGETDRTLRGVKIGLCFFDNYAWRLGLPGAPPSAHYSSTGCARSRLALRIHAGISVGWGDNYPWNFAYQWIDITEMPGGTYMVRTTVDQPNWYREDGGFDNCVWVRVRISAPGTGNRVRVLDRGVNCGLVSVTAVNDFPGSTTFDPARRIAYEPGTYFGRTFNSRGTTLRARKVSIGQVTTGRTMRRAVPPGFEDPWLFITKGPLQGYWVRDTSRIDFLP